MDGLLEYAFFEMSAKLFNKPVGERHTRYSGGRLVSDIPILNVCLSAASLWPKVRATITVTIRKTANTFS